MTAAEELRDRTILHQVYLERLKNGEAQAVVAFLEAMEDDVLDLVQKRYRRIRQKGYDPGPVTTRRVHELAKDLRAILAQYYGEAYVQTRDRLKAIGQNEATFTARTLTQEIPIDYKAALPTTTLLNQVVTTHPFGDPRHAAPLRDWFAGLRQNQQRRLVGAIRQGVAQGESIGRITRRIRGSKRMNFTDGILPTGRREAEAIARTGVHHVTTLARQATYAANAEVLKGVQWHSTLDTRTCPVCGDRDGQVYPVDEGPRPPAHVSCRCAIAPVLKSWRQMGIKRAELTPGQRASMDGTVPREQTFNEWIVKQSAGRQNEVYGIRKGIALRKGTLTPSAFVNDGHVLNLQQLGLN